MLLSSCFSLLPSATYVPPPMTKSGVHGTKFADGSPKFQAHYVAGLFDGEVKSWYANGQLRFERRYKAGNIVGKSKTYFPNGDLYRIYNHNIGKEKVFHPNGHPQIVEDSLLADGTHQYMRWNSSGVLIESVPLVDGEYEGLHQYWSGKGLLMVSGMEKAGERVGVWRFYHESGEERTTHDYNKGKPQIPNSGPTDETPYYEIDGLAYPSGNANAMGKQAPIFDWPSIRDYVFVELEPKPINMLAVSKLIGYPQAARDRGIEGNVVTRVLVNPDDGGVIEAQLLTNPSPILSNEVELHILDLEFSVAEREGKAYPFWVNIPFNFKLQN